MSAPHSSFQPQAAIESEPAAGPGRPRICIVTGGVGCGKSLGLRLLQSQLPRAETFDSDACVHELLTQPEVGDRLSEIFGDSIFAADRQVDRAKLRRLILKNPASRASLEGLLHPLVAEKLTNQLKTTSAPWLLAEVPLFFETATEMPADLVIAIVASPSVQRDRLIKRGLDSSEIEALLAAQWPNGRKMQKADVCLWNDGSKDCLERQIQVLTPNIPFD